MKNTVLQKIEEVIGKVKTNWQRLKAMLKVDKARVI